MKAVVQHAYGPVEQSLRIEERTLPQPAASEVRIRVRAVGLNPLDWKLVEGQFKWMSKCRPPCGVGFELAGEVHEAGTAAATRLARGTRVVGLIPAFQRAPGAVAQFAVVPADSVVPIPANVPFDQAAGLPIGGLSALQMCRQTHIERGRRVLVHGAAGGVGHLAVQIARNLGAEVTAAASQQSAAFLRALRPSHIVDRATRTATWGGPFDAVLDCSATLTPRELDALLGPDGHAISTLPRFPQVIFDTVLNLARRGKRRPLVLKVERAALEHLVEQLASGHLTVAVQQTFPLERTAVALALSRTGRVRGKLVVAVDRDGQPAAGDHG